MSSTHSIIQRVFPTCRQMLVKGPLEAQPIFELSVRNVAAGGCMSKSVLAEKSGH